LGPSAIVTPPLDGGQPTSIESEECVKGPERNDDISGLGGRASRGPQHFRTSAFQQVRKGSGLASVRGFIFRKLTC